MPHHEEKICPLCQAQFECKVGTINGCQCQTVSLNIAETDHIREQFEDCLCAHCLQALKMEHKQNQFKEKVNRAYIYFNFKSPFQDE